MDEEQLIVVISGKQHCVRLIPIGALDGYGVEWIKLTDTKGCTVCCMGNPGGASRTLLCVAMKRHVLIYEITRDKGRHRRLREIPLDYTPQCLNVRGEVVRGLPLDVWRLQPPRRHSQLYVPGFIAFLHHAVIFYCGCRFDNERLLWSQR